MKKYKYIEIKNKSKPIYLKNWLINRYKEIIQKLFGNPITLTKSAGKPLNGLKVFGNTKQETTKTGRNLILTDKKYIESGHYNVNGEKTEYASRSRTKNLIEVQPNTTYYVGSKQLIIREYGTNKNFINSIGLISISQTFTTSSETYFLSISFDCKYDDYIEEDIKLFMCLDTETNKKWEKGVPNSPSPDYPQKLKSVGNLNNLFDIKNIIESTYITNTGSTGQSSVSNLSDFIKVEKNKIYKLEWNYESLQNPSHRNYVFYDNDKNVISGEYFEITDKNATFTSLQDGYLRFSFDKNCTDIFLFEGKKYKIPVKVTSKNACFEILKYESKNAFSTALFVKYEEGKLKPDTYYTVIGKCTPNSRFYIDNQDTTVTSAWTAVTVGDDGILFYVIKSKADISGMKTVNFYKTPAYQILKVMSGGNAELPDFKDVMIVEGRYTRETMPEYQEYINETININLDEPLRKIGDYADYIDFKNGKIVRNIFNCSLNRALNYYSNPREKNEFRLFTNYTFFVSIPKAIGEGYGKYPVCCTHLPNAYNRNIWTTDKIGIDAYGNVLLVCIKSDTADTKTDFQQWVQNNDINLNYIMNTPTEETIELPEILTTTGTNIISIDTTIHADMEVEYTKEV